MSKFFIKNENREEEKVKIVGTDVNHIKNVLRLKVGDKIQVCNQETTENFICEIVEIDKEFVQTKIVEKVKAISEGNVELHIFQGLPKADKMELIIQKGTELGVSKIIPVVFKRSIVKLSGKDEVKKLQRWQKIAEVAAKQSGRDLVPEIKEVVDIKKICHLVQEYDIILLAYEKENENTLKNELLKIKGMRENFKIAIVIGPEGGIEKEEVLLLKNAGAKVVTLGKRILRTETVALAVASIVMYELEDEF